MRHDSDQDKVLNSFKRINNFKNNLPALIKTADRLVNLKHSIEEQKISLLKKYLFEDEMFRTYVLPRVCEYMIGSYLSLIGTAEKIVEQINENNLANEINSLLSKIKDYFSDYYEDFKIDTVVDNLNNIIIYINKQEVIFDIETVERYSEFYDYYFSEVDRLESLYNRKIYLQYNFDDYFTITQRDLEPEFAKILNDNLFDLI